MDSLERFIEERSKISDEHDSQVADVSEKAESVERLRDDLEAEREKNRELRQRNDFLKGKDEERKERDVVSRERYERLQDRHMRLIDAVWSAADPPVVYEEPEPEANGNEQLLTRLLSKLNLWE